jgi:hypothetical protein
MKKVQNLILMIAGMTFIMACHSNHQKIDIELNNGEKWIVNSEMKPHIELSADLLNQFISNQDKDFHQLAKNLKEQNNALIKSCTMKGKSHDELHKWLHPHMELIDELSNAKNYNDAEEIISKLENSFKTYHKYFQ